MRRRMRQWALLVVCLLLMNSVVVSAAEEDSATFRDLTVDEMVAEMGMGINLGNTFDGHTAHEPNETLWQHVKTTQDYITSLHDHGFNTLRIPVTWGTMINDDFSINEDWISRVQDVVDYAISEDMYVIVNIHHDGAEQTSWLLVESDHPDQVLAKFSGVWESISTYFKDYDEHLIFEAMNEVWGESQTVKEDMAMINRLNQAFVDSVRSTGGNNDKRWLLVPGRYTNIDITTDPNNGFAMPEDSIADRLFVSVHDYPMGMGLTNTMGATEFSTTMASNLNNKFLKLQEAFTSKGIPVILGEYGVTNKNNTVEREYYYEVVNHLAKVYGVVPVAWEIGEYNLESEPEPDYSMVFVDRITGQAIYPTIIEAMWRGTFLDGSSLNLDGIVKPTVENPTPITTVTDISLSDTELGIFLGDVRQIGADLVPADANEAILWRSDDTSVATVYNGLVIARGIGETSLYAYTLSGSVEKTIALTVEAVDAAVPCDKITVNTKMSLVAESAKNLFAKNGTEGSVDHLSYVSSDESVATVNRFGKVVGIAAGTCEIIITADSGFSKIVEVTVTEKPVISDMTIGLNVYFNDSASGFYGNEVGEAITVNGDGTYKLTFDSALHLSAGAKDGGVTGLNNMGALYIKDVTASTTIESCDILYTSVIVDGKPLTVTQTEPKSALKDSGILDTNDPINAWDGSQVAEVVWDQSNFNVNIDGMDNPQVIEVIFELSNVKFKGSDGMAGDGDMNLYVDAPEVDAVPEVEEEVDPEPSPEPSIAPEQTGDDDVATDDASDNSIVQVIIYGLIAGIVAFGVVFFARRKK